MTEDTNIRLKIRDLINGHPLGKDIAPRELYTIAQGQGLKISERSIYRLLARYQKEGDLAPTGVASQLKTLIESVPKGKHLTTSEIYEMARASGMKASLSTIYRAVDKLQAEGFLQTIRTPRAAAFESVSQRANHDHLICFNCGETLECESIFSQLGELIAQRNGFEFQHSELILKGLCEKCQDTQDKV
ncbi:MAG: transcriptional repressor [Cyanobacteria bacterium SZAS LIN-2]|nr:transcriptional repressor [Cyanobacteria bacterium SZAS LIN-3]MBS1997025.1 transcriptional repressor [Cyanobacteria bacterium SZAS LIN-2]MBS2008265.1 transcriptional repressor [Cyanobacteria bacterium SZAS TMP-1]